MSGILLQRKNEDVNDELLMAARAPLLSIVAPSIAGETIASQIGRYHVLSGHISPVATFRELFGRSPFLLSHWIPRHLVEIARRFPGTEPDNVESLLRHNTLFPLFEAFAGATLGSKRAKAKIDEILDNMPKRLVGESGATYLCPQCLQEDRSDFGTPIIRLAHQIPGVLVCYKHGVALLDRCPTCRCPIQHGPDLILFPWVGCRACGSITMQDSSPRKATAQSKAFEFSKFANALLEMSLPQLSAEQLARLYLDRSRIHGLVCGERLNRVKFLEAFDEFYGRDLRQRMDATYRSRRMSGWFQFASKSAASDVPLTRHLMVSFFLFGDVHSFVKAAHQAQQLCSKVRGPKQVVKDDADDRSEEVLLTLKAIAKQYGECDIDLLWGEHYGLMKKFVKAEPQSMERLRKWLESRNRKRRVLTTIPFPEQPKNDDARWAGLVRRAAEGFYASSDKPTRCSRSLLLVRAGWKSRSITRPYDYPLLCEELERQIESAWYFYLRRMLWALVRIGEKPAVRASIWYIAKIPWDKLEALLSFVDEKNAWSILLSEPIPKTLQLLGVPLQWAGPQPNRVFCGSGRAYVKRKKDD